MKTREIECPYCNKNKYTLMWEKSGFHYVKCNYCDLIFVNPQLEYTEIEKIYSKGFESKALVKENNQLNEKSYIDIIRWMEKYRKSNKVLDIGCFTGEFLRIAEKHKWVAEGVEISEKAAKFAQENYSLNVKLGELSSLNLNQDHYDIVTMFDVIEHVDNPLKYLEEVNKLIRPGGAIYLNTPNINGIAHKIFGKDWSAIFPWHQFYFTEKTLYNVAKKAGFNNIEIISVGLGPLSSFDPLQSYYNKKVISPPKNSIVKKIKKCKTCKEFFYYIKPMFYKAFEFLSNRRILIGSTLILKASK